MPVAQRGDRTRSLRSPERFWRVLLVIAVGALAVRVGYVAVAKHGPCPLRIGDAVVGSYPSECALGDQLFYNAAANQLARGNGFVEPLWEITHPGDEPPPAADHPPLTALALAPVSFLVERAPVRFIAGDDFDTNVREHRYAMAVLGTALVVLIGLLGRRVGGDRAGLLAAVIAAAYPNLWVNDALVMSETVTGLAVVGALLLALRFVEHPGIRSAAALGACCGAAALARAELVLFVPLLAVPAALALRGRPRSERFRYAGVATLAAVIVLAPWVGYNLARFDEPTYLSTNDGIALAGSNCAPVYSGGGIGLTAITGHSACIDSPHPEGDQSVVASIYRDRALEYMRDHWKRVPIVVAARVARTWSLYRPLDMVSFNEGEGRERWVTRLGLIAYYPLLVAAIAGAVALRRRNGFATLWVLLVPAIAVSVGVAVTYGQTRFRATAEPSIVVLAAIAAMAVSTGHRNAHAVSAGADTEIPRTA